MDELIVLTPDNVKQVEFHNLKSPERDQLIRNLMEKVPESVQNSSRLLEKHPEQETRATLTKRLTFAIRKLSEDSVDKELLDLGKVSAHIDLEKLCWPIRKKERFKDAGIVRENGKDFYAQIILDALQTEIDGHAEYTKEYDCCEHVQFLQSNEFTTDRDEESLVCSSVVSIK
ncbi:uncharacterized protein LOC114574284 [Exaiptasia diaphana]|uniref:Uncharacterized protein n=1 Tax=Exaiptasia diaphana TaxID=2652724 RepID=A0A913YF73_EXADI|nr:uncharacterized protein LOC114574284 [Exaiptasia diaphana]